MAESLWRTLAIAKREFAAYFATPIASVFLIVFVGLTGALTFYVGNFFERGQADLYPFFAYHPWLYLLLVPAVAMRLWAEERKTGTFELLMTLPISPWEAVIGKFVAAWAFVGLALALTFPIWITVNVLGHPDNGVIFASYVGSFLMAGAFLALGAFVSALTKNQVIAFILAATLCFLFVATGIGLMQNVLRSWVPGIVASAVSSMSFLPHFSQIAQGVVTAPTVILFLSTIAFALFANVVAIGRQKAA